MFLYFNSNGISPGLQPPEMNAGDPEESKGLGVVAHPGP